jgi:hypothetical protein
MIVVNMPAAANTAAFMAQVAPQDGTVIGIVSQGLAADQALGMSPQLKANLREFNWIANVIFSNQLLVVWHTSPTKTLDDAKRRVTAIGTTGAGSASVQYPAFYNNVLGTRFKIVFGYPSGAHIDLAMERGEVEGRGTNPYSSYMATHPTWMPQKLVIPLVQAGIEKEPALPDVPRSAICRRRLRTSRYSNSARAATVDGRSPPRLAFRPSAWLRCAALPWSRIRSSSRCRRAELGDQAAERRTIQGIITGLLDAPADVRERMKTALQPKDEHVVDGPQR